MPKHLNPPTPADDLFLHQIVAPQGEVVTDQRWGERSFFSAPLGPRGLFEMGLRAYPQRGVVEGYAVVRRGGEQLNVRSAGAYSLETPLSVSAGAIRSEAVEPIREWRLEVEAPEHGIEAELTYTARTSAFYCDPVRIERDGEVLVHNLTFFQSGRYSGRVRVDGEEYELDGDCGARDRSWGHRKRESAPSRGMMSWIGIERPRGAVIAWIYEKADGTRTYTHGAWLDEDGGIRHVEEVEHRYEFDPDDGSLRRGELVIDGQEIEFDVHTVLYMSGAGHVEGEGRSGSLEPGTVHGERWSFDSAAEALRRRSVDDHLATFRLGDEEAHGIVEVARGVHAAYGEPPAVEGEEG